MPEQTVLFTAVPDGVIAILDDGGVRVRVRVHVGPRLLTAGQLADYSDWLHWPETVAGVNWELRFPGRGPNFTVPAQLGTDLVPDQNVWGRLFPGTTPVNGRRMLRLTNRLLHSYSTETVTQFLRDRWGRYGAEFADQYPDFDTLVDDDGFGPIAFEKLQLRDKSGDESETGPQRRERLLLEHHERFDVNAAEPDRWALEHLALPASGVARRDEIGRRFLELEHFHVRGRRGAQKDTLPEEHRAPTFHELVAMVQRYPRLLRALGLVFVLEADLTEKHFTGASGTAVQVGSTWLPAVQHRPVYARTMGVISPSEFQSLLNPNGDGDLVGRQLKLGDPRFRVDTADPDAGAIRAMQFADNVARSHPDLIDVSKPSSAYTDGEFALPAQVSGGISVSRVNRANRLAHLFLNMHKANESAFDGHSVPLPPLPGQEPPSPLFWADDLVRGYRWDVMATSDGHWRSLMQTKPEDRYVVGPPDDVLEVEAGEEGISVTGLTSAGGASPGDDLYAHESLMKWEGWSLAVRKPGNTVGRDDGVADPDVPTAPDGTAVTDLAPLKARPSPKPGSLPRLRFGETYRVRARAVDISGASDDLDAPTEPGAETPEVDYLRFEPVSAPITALRAPAEIPGETNTVVVVRSENAADGRPDENHRHVLPPRTNITMAERHGMLDTDGVGQPLDLQALAKLGHRDAQDLSMHPDIQPPVATGPNDQRWFPVGTLAVNYLPDPLAKRVLFRDLPAGPGGATDATLDIATAAWPEWNAAGLVVKKSDANGWSPVGNQLVVYLRKGEDRFVRVNSRYDDDDSELMALWPWIVEWCTKQGTGNLDQIHARVKAGRHWMFTPWRTLRLVHAVRTPLLAPTLPDPGIFAVKHSGTPAATFADIRWEAFYSRRSTAQLDLLARWHMKVDNGPKKGHEPTVPPDPTLPQEFRAVAATFPLDHRSPGPDNGYFEAKHEFGDTKYRSVEYHAVATSAFTEFFRDETEVTVPGPTPTDERPAIPVDSRGLVASTVVVKVGDVPMRQGSAADYTVDEAAGTLKRGPLSSISSGDTLKVSYVAPSIHTRSPVRTQEVRSSARPAAPAVEYVVPTFRWQRIGNQSTRRGNSLRVYLRRPWWSSGDDERLGVVLWRRPSGVLDPPQEIKPYVTMWGLDPVFNAPEVSTTPVLASFPLAVGSAQDVSLAELEGTTVDVAAHEVAFDAERDLWYADIELNFGLSAKAYFPFVRLALCRYQPHSLDGVEISPVVLADYTQVTPNRSVTVTVNNTPTTERRFVQVLGRAYSANASADEPSRVQAFVERTRDGVTDPHLKWVQAGSTVTLSRSVSDGNLVTWSGNVVLPTATGPRRLVVEEVEVHRTGSEPLIIGGAPPGGRRVVFTDIIEL